MISSALQRQIWLIDVILNSPKRLTFKEINELWQRSTLNETRDELSKRTFFSQIKSISDNFGITIECDARAGYLYSVSFADVEYGSIKRTLLNSFIISNAIELRPEVTKRVQVAKSFGEANLSPILGAILKNHCLRIHHYEDMTSLREYKPEFGNTQDVDYSYEVEPYGLYYRGIWFLIGKVKQDQRLHIYDITKLIEIDELPESFSYPEDFDLKEYVAQYNSDVEIQSFTGVIDDGSLFDITYGHLS